MDVVAAGVPFVTVPIAFDQAAIAARINRAKLGCVVGRRGPDLLQRLTLGLSETARSEALRAARRQARFEAMAAPGVDGVVAAMNDALKGHSWGLSGGLSGAQSGATSGAQPGSRVPGSIPLLSPAE
jgi:UDP:flavonoid glycosyltransferase YjiC (YdhE family)